MLGEGQEKEERERKGREGEERVKKKGKEEGEERDFASFNVLREQVAITNFIKHWPLVTIMSHNVLCDKRRGIQSPAESKAR